MAEESGKDIPKKRQRLEQHLIPFFGDMPLGKISGFDLERYKKQRREEAAAKSNSRGQGKVT
ncbi:hypothetical protein MishRS11D_19530 [Methylomagnum ishizawai]|nr:hypothetical protein MishRS11D_19530 [Methylomagnum ishizawai]